MKVVNSDDEYVFITCDKEQTNYNDKRAIFIPEKIFETVKTFIETTKVKADKDYWEEDRHEKITQLLITLTNYDRRNISNSLSALGL